MASNTDQTPVLGNQHDTGVAVIEDTTQLASGLANDTVDHDASSAVDDATMEDRQDIDNGGAESVVWQPNEEDLAAAAAFDQANTPQPQFTDEQLLQQFLDHEMALQFQALEQGEGYNISLPRNDIGMPPETFECACGETFTHLQMSQGEAVALLCPHVRCKECLNQNVRVGLSSRQNFPPKCCGPLDIIDIVDHLEDDVRALWFEKQEEYSDVAPVYCAIKECSQYLNKDALLEDGKWALCDKCNAKTCTGCLCLQSAHEKGSAECPERIDKMDKDLMVKQGWKACPRCSNMIERTEGCDHMTCDCGQDFCYTCGRLLHGAMACNCSGQRQWAEDEEEENNPQAQQQIMDAILNGGRQALHVPLADGDHDGNDIVDPAEDEEEDHDEEVNDNDGDVWAWDERAAPWSQADLEGTRTDNDLFDADTDDQAAVQEGHEEMPHASPRARDAITDAIRTLYETEPELGNRMTLLSNVQIQPYNLPGFAADVRRVREMTGEAFNNEMRNLEQALITADMLEVVDERGRAMENVDMAHLEDEVEPHLQ